MELYDHVLNHGYQYYQGDFILALQRVASNGQKRRCANVDRAENQKYHSFNRNPVRHPVRHGGILLAGTNIGTANPLPADVLKARGYTFVRLVSLHEHESYATSLRDNGIAVLAVVIPAQSGGYVMSNADVYQFDNERDMDQGAAAYRDEATFYQRTYPNLTWISCGMASGQTSWWKNVTMATGNLPGFSGFAVHPYNKTPDQARTLLKSYQGITPQMDCWVTEWNRPAAEIPRMQKILKENAVHSFWFCSDCGVPGFEEMPLVGRA